MNSNARIPFGTYLGTFLICCALLAFEVSSVRTINFAVGPSYIFVAIALAMLGLTAAGSIMSRFDLSKVQTDTGVVLAVLCLCIAALIVGAHLFIADAKEGINSEIRNAGLEDGSRGIFQYLLVASPVAAARVGLALTVPYFLFGALLSFLFARAPSQGYGALYAADLFGAALGCVAIVVTMEITGYAASVSAPAIAAVLAAAAFIWSSRRVFGILCVAGALGLLLVVQTSAYRAVIEPSADPNYLVRDYNMQFDHVERWTGWNSFTRVAAIEKQAEPGQGAVLSLSNGDGMAFLVPYQVEGIDVPVHPPAIPALMSGPADSALVIFAGAGADLMSLRANGVNRVVGVELNRRLVEAGHALPEYNLAQFLSEPDVDLHIEEARSFLERDTETYDVVLVSWSGATLVFQLGGLGGTTDYVFTYEGLSAVLDRVSDKGRAVILQTNKLDMMHGLRRYLVERGISTDPTRTTMVFYKDSMAHQWDNPWDDNPMLVKLSGWSDEEVANTVQEAAKHGFKVAYAPGLQTDPNFQAYERMLSTDQPEAELAAISAEANKRFGVASDNRPFHMDHFNPARYMRSEFWAFVADSRDSPSDVFHYGRVILTLAVGFIAFVLALVPLAYSGRRVKSRGRAASFMAYFMALGAGFMFIEIALIQRTSILLGNPGLTIAVVLCAVILSTGLGSLISNKSFEKGLTLRTAALGVIAYAVLAALILPYFVTALMGAPLMVNILAVAALIAPGGIIMGHLFPQGLALAQKEDVTLVPWAWAINGAMSAAVAGLAPLVAQVTGFAALFYIGAAFYGLVLLIPLTSSARSGSAMPLANTPRSTVE